jgi:hypothetical protein
VVSSPDHRSLFGRRAGRRFPDPDPAGQIFWRILGNGKSEKKATLTGGPPRGGYFAYSILINILMPAKFFLPFFYSFSLSILLVSFFLWAGKKFGLKTIRRSGGMAVILVFAFFVVFNKDIVITRPILGILAGGALILVFGFWDDLKNLNWKKQLIFQIIIALAAIHFQSFR